MYAYIKGTVVDVREDSVIVDNQGIGYRIFAPASVLRDVIRGEERKFYTYFAVKEDAMQLFGFLSEDDLAVYRLLLGVSGIGFKGALSILSVMDADDLRFAVLSDDASAIAKAPGIGKKTAAKVVLELKDRLDLGDAFEKKAAHVAESGEKSGDDAARNDAIAALTALGYSQSDAFRAVKAASAKAVPGSGAEELVRSALRELFS